MCVLANLGVCDRECVDPHTPASPLMLDGVIEKDAEDGVHHLCDLQLLTAARIYKAERQHPLLPHRALQETPKIHICDDYISMFFSPHKMPSYFMLFTEKHHY